MVNSHKISRPWQLRDFTRARHAEASLSLPSPQRGAGTTVAFRFKRLDKIHILYYTIIYVYTLYYMHAATAQFRKSLLFSFFSLLLSFCLSLSAAHPSHPAPTRARTHTISTKAESFIRPLSTVHTHNIHILHICMSVCVCVCVCAQLFEKLPTFN